MASNKPCHTCQHRRCKTEVKARGHATVWGCGKRGIRFGYQWQYEAGDNMPVKCGEWLGLSFELCNAEFSGSDRRPLE